MAIEEHQKDMEHLLGHHYRLYSVGSRIDSSTPKSYYASPKSKHYRPFRERRAKSTDGKAFALNDRARSFIKPQSRMSSANSFAARHLNSSMSYSQPSQQPPVKSTYENVRPKITSMRCYQPPMPKKKFEKPVIADLPVIFPDVSQNQSTPTRPPVVPKNEKNARERMDAFKDLVLSEVIRRGVYTDSVIKDSLNHQAAFNHSLSLAELQRVAVEILTEFGISFGDSHLPKKKVNIAGAANLPHKRTENLKLVLEPEAMRAVSERKNSATDDPDEIQDTNSVIAEEHSRGFSESPISKNAGRAQNVEERSSSSASSSSTSSSSSESKSSSNSSSSTRKSTSPLPSERSGSSETTSSTSSSSDSLTEIHAESSSHSKANSHRNPDGASSSSSRQSSICEEIARNNVK